METIQTFSQLSAGQRGELRDAHRRHFVDEAITARRPLVWLAQERERETQFDNLDFSG
jgi:hypothetical protein